MGLESERIRKMSHKLPALMAAVCLGKKLHDVQFSLSSLQWADISINFDISILPFQQALFSVICWQRFSLVWMKLGPTDWLRSRASQTLELDP